MNNYIHACVDPKYCEDCWKRAREHIISLQERLADEQAENARLQERVEGVERELESHRAAASRTILRRDVLRLGKERDEAEALAERRKKALPAIVFALAYSDYGEPGITVESCIEKWERHLKPALQEEHSGDCTNQCHSCARCQAEDCVKMADELARAAIEEEGP